MSTISQRLIAALSSGDSLTKTQMRAALGNDGGGGVTEKDLDEAVVQLACGAHIRCDGREWKLSPTYKVA